MGIIGTGMNEREKKTLFSYKYVEMMGFGDYVKKKKNQEKIGSNLRIVKTDGLRINIQKNSKDFQKLNIFRKISKNFQKI